MSSASQAIIRILRTRKVHYSIHNSPPLVHIFRQIACIQSTPSHSNPVIFMSIATAKWKKQRQFVVFWNMLLSLRWIKCICRMCWYRHIIMCTQSARRPSNEGTSRSTIIHFLQWPVRHIVPSRSIRYPNQDSSPVIWTVISGALALCEPARCSESSLMNSTLHYMCELCVGIKAL